MKKPKMTDDEITHRIIKDGERLIDVALMYRKYGPTREMTEALKRAAWDYGDSRLMQESKWRGK